jgi:hypothetical protein
VIRTHKISTAEIECRVASFFDPRKNIVVPNVSWGVSLHECDILVIRPSGYGIEVEIKISKSDLIADAKKHHHHHDRMGRISELYFAIPDYMKDSIEYIPEDAGILVLSRYDHYHYGLDLSILRKPKINKGRGKFTDAEMLKVAHLGTMRIWNLKSTLNSYNRKVKKKKVKDQSQLKLWKTEN